MNEQRPSSRLSGFHRADRRQRLQRIEPWLAAFGARGADGASLVAGLNRGGLALEQAEQLIENVIGLHGLPFAVAPNFVVNAAQCLMPMVIEEPSVVAAAANAARLARAGGGFAAEADPPLMICQIQLEGTAPERAEAILAAAEDELLAAAAEVDPRLVAAGGGPRALELRRLEAEGDEPAMAVIHLLVDVRDAMGANAVNSMAEAIAPRIAELTGGRIGLRILSNLADRRLVRARCRVPLAALGMPGYAAERVRDGVAAASRFAERDPYRAATHNKGIMNGVDAVLLATGNDWRAVEAGAHAFAARDGRYRPLATWRVDGRGDLCGTLCMPMAVGVIGGAARVHPNARLALALLGVERAGDLAERVAAAGLANNLAALRALATEGIQRGHMRLHRRSRKPAEGG